MMNIETSDSTGVLKSIDIPEANISLHANGIVYVFFKDNMVLDLDCQKKLFACYDKITNKKEAPFLFQAGNDVIVTKEARSNSIVLEANSPKSATAVVVSNLAYKLIANFYLSFNKPKKPYKVFDNEKAAVNWLKNYL